MILTSLSRSRDKPDFRSHSIRVLRKISCHQLSWRPNLTKGISKLRSYHHTGFFELVYRTVRLVPKGRLTTYSSVAKYLGNPRGSRAVGWAMRVCPYPNVPCHRVVRSDGLVSGYPDDVKKRIVKLKREKIKVRGLHVDLSKHFFEFK